MPNKNPIRLDYVPGLDPPLYPGIAGEEPEGSRATSRKWHPLPYACWKLSSLTQKGGWTPLCCAFLRTTNVSGTHSFLLQVCNPRFAGGPASGASSPIERYPLIPSPPFAPSDTERRKAEDLLAQNRFVALHAPLT
jgi:hypothetical protein